MSVAGCAGTSAGRAGVHAAAGAVTRVALHCPLSRPFAPVTTPCRLRPLHRPLGTPMQGSGGPFSWLLPVCVVGSGQDMAEGPRSPHEASWWQPPAAPSSHVSPRPDGCHLSPSDTRGPGYPLAPPQLPASLPAPGSAITLPPPPGSSRPHTPAGLRDITAPPGPRNACWASREPGECSHS